jgi:hypothetical protein
LIFQEVKIKMGGKMFERAKDSFNRWRLKQFLSKLTTCKFNKVWKGKDLEAFHTFLCEQAVPSGGFLLALELETGGLSWIFYEIEEGKEIGGMAKIRISKIVASIPYNEQSRDSPSDYRGYPVWRV